MDGGLSELEVSVALQGTIETFALPDVLRLLGSTRKTGRLIVNGERGSGSIWTEDGGVVSSEASGVRIDADPVDVLFELLRYHEGSFIFESDSPPPDAGERRELDPLLAKAEKMLSEWLEIEKVVPSMESWVELVAELPSSDIVVDASRWRSIAAVGGGTTVHMMGEALELDEMPACRVVKEMVEGGLVTVGNAPRVTAAPARELGPPQEEFVQVEVVEEEPIEPARLSAVEELEDSGGSLLEDLEADEHASFEFPDSIPAAPWSPGKPEFDSTPVYDTAAFKPEREVVASGFGNDGFLPAVDQEGQGLDEPGDEHAAEVARQLANLSPKAAKAVAAAARATSEEEREAALAEADDESDEPINKGLLLKFLGTSQP